MGTRRMEGGNVTDLTPFTDDEINDLLSATLHGPLPHATMLRVFATLAEVPGLRARIATLLKQSYEDAAFGDS